MKKIAFVLFPIFTFMFLACGGETEPEEDTQIKPKEIEQNEETIESKKYDVNILNYSLEDGAYSIELTNYSIEPFITGFELIECKVTDFEGNSYRSDLAKVGPLEEAIKPNETKSLEGTDVIITYGGIIDGARTGHQIEDICDYNDEGVYECEDRTLSKVEYCTFVAKEDQKRFEQKIFF